MLLSTYNYLLNNKMKKFFLMFFLLLVKLATAQQSELSALVDKLQASCSKVETANKTYEQEIKLLEYSSIRYSFTEIDQKGNRTSYSYDFNFADLDAYAVREVTQKDIILVVLAVKNKQKLVKGSKNGEALAYDNELSIHARNVDHAREMLDIIKKCIPLGEKITNGKLKISGYEELVAWLTAHVKDASVGAKSITQNIRPDNFVGSFVLTQVESDGKTSKQTEYTFNLADINLNTINFKVSGNRFGVGFDMTQKLKSIRVFENGQSKSFADDLLIYTSSVEEARDIKTVLNMAVPLAEAKVKSDLPIFKTEQDGLANLATWIKDLKINDKAFTQTINSNCLASLIITEQTASSATKNSFDFNWMDINPNLVQIKTSGERMTLEMTALEKKKLLVNSKNGKFEGYDSDVSIYVENFETGRRLRHAVGKVIEGCKSNYKEPFTNAPNSILEWLKANVGEVAVEQASKKQTWEAVEDGNDNKVKLTNIEIKSSSSVQEVYEFNLGDINPTSINYEIKGKWLYVTFETNFKNKIIKAYKDGKIQPYVYSLDIAMKDVESARGAIAALKKLAENFKGK
jgi:hypothetical protein